MTGSVPPVISLVAKLLRYLLRLRFSFLVFFPITVNRFGRQLLAYSVAGLLYRIVVSYYFHPLKKNSQCRTGYCSQYPSGTARKLAQFVGKIISMGFVFGNISRIMTRYRSHFDILRSPTWDGKISLSGSTLNELCFWKENIPFLNSRRLLSVQSHYTRVCYSDASSMGCASYILEFDNTISHKMWGVEEVQKSSSFRELKAISLGLESFLPLVKGHTIKWYTDNQSVSRIAEVGSMKEDLQCLALRIFSMCLLNSITLEVEWIPRSANDKADFLSRASHGL